MRALRQNRIYVRPPTRLIDLQVGCPFDFELIGMIDGGVRRESILASTADTWGFELAATGETS
jgi:hypothetical protein